MSLIIEQRTISRLKKDDKITIDEHSATINGVRFIFSSGTEITFITPSNQILNPYRDADGNLNATVIQYVLEIGNQEICEQEVEKSIDATIEELSIDDELAQIEMEIQEIKEQTKNMILDRLVEQELSGN